MTICHYKVVLLHTQLRKNRGLLPFQKLKHIRGSEHGLIDYPVVIPTQTLKLQSTIQEYIQQQEQPNRIKHTKSRKTNPQTTADTTIS